MKTIALFFLLAFSFVGYGQSFTWTGHSLANCGTAMSAATAGSFTSIPIVVSGIGNLGTCGSMGLESVKIQIPSSDARDVEIWLKSPAGTYVLLSSGNVGYWTQYGASSAGVTTDYCCFNKSAPASITTLPNNGAVDAIGAYIPQGNLDDFNNGQNANGTWELLARDITCWFRFYVDEYVLVFGDCSSASYGNCSAPVILPVEMLSFTGENQNAYNELTWETTTEINNAHFEVEKSDDGIIFEQVDVVLGGGNSNELLEYKYQDVYPKEITYYRLKQVDFNGAFKYSNIIAIKSELKTSVNAYPNPSTGSLFMDIEGTSNGLYTIAYIDVLGGIIKEQIKIDKGVHTYQLTHFEKIAKGIYFIQVLDRNDDVIFYQKIIKK